jgi:L-ascorbate metabolism protein UlaG (beta-lactamase superfamily)
MEITYIGHSCFKIKGKSATLVIDPFDSKIGLRMPKIEADVVLSTHDHFDHNNFSAVTGSKLNIDGPGDYEVSGAFITGIATFHDDKGGAERGTNTVYSIDLDGINLVHLGDLGHELKDDELEKLSKVDVLFIPVGGKYTIDSETASKVISSIEPGIVIPMHYKTATNLELTDMAPLEKFLDEMGIKDTVKKVDKLKINSENDIPEETEIVVLTPTK